MSFSGFPLPGQAAENWKAKASGGVKDEPATTVAPPAAEPLLKLLRTSFAVSPGCSDPWDPEDPWSRGDPVRTQEPRTVACEASSPGSLGSALPVAGAGTRQGWSPL